MIFAARDPRGGFDSPLGWSGSQPCNDDATLPVVTDPVDSRRMLPAVDALLRDPALASTLESTPRGVVVDAIRAALARRREEGIGPHGLPDEVAALSAATLRPVLNATGVVLHTNLGRAPLAPEAVRAAMEAANYSTLEWDPSSGERGSRQVHTSGHLRALSGAPASCVANSCAGAVLLALVALASGREVIVSRGELVEIGGGFRIPEVLLASGCTLVEVGTTNRTRLADYERAIGPGTAAILRVHPSNFRVVGFTETPEASALAALAHDHGLLLIEDLGSGAIRPEEFAPDEPSVRDAVDAGADVVCFSGDKLLGGPQAGIMVGGSEPIAAIRAHPLMRALRPDKLTLAALEATLALHRDPGRARRSLPTARMLTESPETRRVRAEALATLVGGDVVATVGRVGGGALPLLEIPSFAVAIEEAIAAALRLWSPAIATRFADGHVLLDVLCLTDDELPLVGAGVAAARKLT